MENLYETTATKETEIEEAVVAEPEGQQQEAQESFDDWDKQKSVDAYVALQKKITEREKALKETERKAIQLEERLKMFSEQTQVSEQQTEPPRKPVRPQKPKDYSFEDARIDPQSPSAKFDEQLQNYLLEKEIYDDYEKGQLQRTISTFEEERKKIQQKEQFAQLKASRISRLMTAGADENKAYEVDKFLEKAMTEDDPRWYIEFYDFVTQNKNQLKTQQTQKRSERQGQVVSPALSQQKAELQDTDENVSIYRADKSNLFTTQAR